MSKKVLNGFDIGADVYLSGELSPSQITADQNDYSPTGLAGASVLRLDTDANWSITGLAGGTDGRMISLINVGANNITLLSEDSNSSAANRFAFDYRVIVTPNRGVMLWYDVTSSRWRLINQATTGSCIIYGNTTDKTIPQNATTYFGLASNRGGTSGVGDTTDPSTTAADVERAFLCPKSGVIRSFYIQLDGSPGTSNQIAFTVMLNGVATSVTCTVSGTNVAANDQTNSFVVAAGDLLSLKCVASTTLTASRSATWGCELVIDDAAVADPGVMYKVKTADETVTSSSTIQDDDHLSFSVAAGRVYEISGSIQADNASNNIDIKVAFQLPTSGSMNINALGMQNAGGNAVQGTGLMTASNTSKTFVISGGVSTLIRFNGTITTAGNSGTVKFRWAQGTSNAQGTTVRQNSWMTLRRVA